MRHIILVVLLACFTGKVYSQNYSANLIRLEKWAGPIYMFNSRVAELEGSGGGPRPAYNVDTDTLRFSYLSNTVSQIAAISSVLEQQDIRIGGYRYSWQIYNDLNNEIGTRGSLTGTLKFKNTSGDTVESKTFDYSQLNTGANFLPITGTESFKTPYEINSLGNFEIYWTGKDINNWSGFYGPRVRYVNVQLTYSKIVDSKPPTKSAKEDLPIVETENAQTVTKEIAKELPLQQPSKQSSILNSIRINNTKQEELQKETVLTSIVQQAESSRLDSEQLALNIASQSTSQAHLNNLLVNRTNPLTGIVESTTKTSINTVREQESSTVNKLASNSELSAGVDIAAIAIQPAGFNQYAMLTIKDAIFYSPREIYRGQKTIDNARALRQLASDRLHQQMLDQQWRQP